VDIHTKGIDLLVEAFAGVLGEYPDVNLKLVGRGDEGQVRRLRQLVDEGGLGGRAEVIVAVSEEEKRELLSRALFMCAPSRYEGWGMAAVEASASAKAVLGTRIEGLRDAVVDGETGLLVEPGSAQALLG
jgi:glycosyltransferase involved in cell wall biosynthesis